MITLEYNNIEKILFKINLIFLDYRYIKKCI